MRILLVTLLTMLATLGSAFAQNGGSVVIAIAKQQAELVGVDEEISKAQKNLEDIVRKYEALDDEETLIVDKVNRLSAEDKARVSSYNAACKDKEVTSQCTSAYDELQAYHRSIAPGYKQMLARKAEINTAMRKLESDGTIADFSVKKLRNYRTEVEAAIGMLRAQLSASCPGSSKYTSIEELKLKCGNVQFDGASPTLPPCTTRACQMFRE